MKVLLSDCLTPPLMWFIHRSSSGGPEGTDSSGTWLVSSLSLLFYSVCTVTATNHVRTLAKQMIKIAQLISRVRINKFHQYAQMKPYEATVGHVSRFSSLKERAEPLQLMASGLELVLLRFKTSLRYLSFWFCQVVGSDLCTLKGKSNHHSLKWNDKLCYMGNLEV